MGLLVTTPSVIVPPAGNVTVPVLPKANVYSPLVNSLPAPPALYSVGIRKFVVSVSNSVLSTVMPVMALSTLPASTTVMSDASEFNVPEKLAVLNSQSPTVNTVPSVSICNTVALEMPKNGSPNPPPSAT